jgi:hypothetical protein
MSIGPVTFGLLVLVLATSSSVAWYSNGRLKRNLGGPDMAHWYKLAEPCLIYEEKLQPPIWVNGSLGNGYTSLARCDIAVLVTGECVVFVYCGFFRYHPYIVVKKDEPTFTLQEKVTGTTIKERERGVSLRNFQTIDRLAEDLRNRGWTVAVD